METTLDLTKALNVHHFKHGEKVTLEIKEFRKTSISGNGYRWSVIYITSDDICFNHICDNEKLLDIPKDKYVKVTAKIKHYEYRGFPVTRLINLKLVEINDKPKHYGFK